MGERREVRRGERSPPLPVLSPRLPLAPLLCDDTHHPLLPPINPEVHPLAAFEAAMARREGRVESLHLMDASATLTAAHLRRHFAQFGEVLTVEVCDTIKGSRLKVVVQVKSPNKHLVNDLRRKVHWVEGLEVVEEGEWEMRREKVEELASMWNRFP